MIFQASFFEFTMPLNAYIVALVMGFGVCYFIFHFESKELDKSDPHQNGNLIISICGDIFIRFIVVGAIYWAISLVMQEDYLDGLSPIDIFILWLLCAIGALAGRVREALHKLIF